MSSNPKGTDEGVLTSPVPKRGGFPIYLGPLVSFKPNTFDGTLTLQGLKDLEKLHLPTVKEQTILMSQCPDESGLKPLFSELFPKKQDRTKANTLKMIARISLVMGPSKAEWEKIIVGEDNKEARGGFRRFHSVLQSKRDR